MYLSSSSQLGCPTNNLYTTSVDLLSVDDCNPAPSPSSSPLPSPRPIDSSVCGGFFYQEIAPSGDTDDGMMQITSTQVFVDDNDPMQIVDWTELANGDYCIETMGTTAYMRYDVLISASVASTGQGSLTAYAPGSSCSGQAFV